MPLIQGREADVGGGSASIKSLHNSSSLPDGHFLYSSSPLAGEDRGEGEGIQVASLFMFQGILAQMSNSALADSNGEFLYYFHNDHLGTPLFLTDVSGTVVWKGEYWPFGDVFSEDKDPDADGVNVTQPFRFPGQYADSATGLYYNYFRDYDPQLGRYVEADPIGLAGGVNLWGYAGQMPVGFKDVQGLDYWIEGPTAGEPPGHLSINVGDPMGKYYSYSFGINANPDVFFEGEVYKDVNKGGRILPGAYRKTTTDEDNIIKEYLDSLVGDTAPYRPWRTCRSFSVGEFRNLSQYIELGTKAFPPSRNLPPNSPSTAPNGFLSSVPTETRHP